MWPFKKRFEKKPGYQLCVVCGGGLYKPYDMDDDTAACWCCKRWFTREEAPDGWGPLTVEIPPDK